MNKFYTKDFMTIPNMLTGFRFVSAPLLLLLAWYGQGNKFLLLLAITFLTDILDGMAARMLDLESELGALLDSWGDLLIYTAIALGTWWLWPDLMRRESIYMLTVIVSYLLPVLVGLLKFRAFTSYHTWLVKLAVACMGCSYFVLVLFDMVWPFRWAAAICAFAAAEEIGISLLLSELRSNVRSLWHVKRRLIQGDQKLR